MLRQEILLSPRAGISPWVCQSLSFQAQAISLPSSCSLVSQCLGFSQKTNAVVPVPLLKHVPRTLTLLVTIGKRKKTKHQNKTESRRQFPNLRSWHKTKLVFLHVLKSLSWEILLIFFISLPSSYLNFNLLSRSLSLSLSLSDNLAWVLSNGPAQLLLIQVYNTKEYKEDWKCNYKTVSSAQARNLRQQPPFQHSWKEKNSD